MKAEVALQETTGAAKVLMVDDRVENLLALETVLQPLGRPLIRATSGEEAMKLLLKNEFAVILLDVHMPDLDGFQTAEYIRALERTRHIPILFITAQTGDTAQITKGYTAGAVDYVVKPFEADVLRSKVSVFIDLFEKRRALQEGEERFRKAFESAPIGFALVDSEGHWLRVNKALCDMFGFPEARFLASKIDEFVHPDDPPIALTELRLALGGEGRGFHTEQRFVAHEGKIVHGLVSLSLVSDAFHGEPYFIIQINDITEQKRLEEFRQRFIANAAHELRIPVSVLVGTTVLLSKYREQLPPEEFEKCLEALQRQGDRLNRLVEALLDLTRLQEGAVSAVTEAVDLRDVVDSVVQNTPPPDGKLVDIAVDDGVAVLVDAQSLDQILVNLIANAYRYGGPTVTISAHRDNGSVLVEVADDGGGVPEDLEEKLFEPFARGRDSAKVGGSGLGLSLARSLAQASGGDIDYYANQPNGARFVVRLKAADGD